METDVQRVFEPGGGTEKFLVNASVEVFVDDLRESGVRAEALTLKALEEVLSVADETMAETGRAGGSGSSSSSSSSNFDDEDDNDTLNNFSFVQLCSRDIAFRLTNPRAGEAETEREVVLGTSSGAPPSSPPSIAFRCGDSFAVTSKALAKEFFSRLTAGPAEARK